MTRVAESVLGAQAPPEHTLSDVYAAIGQLRGDFAAQREMLVPITLYGAGRTWLHRGTSGGTQLIAEDVFSQEARNGAALRAHRLALGLSQRDLAAEVRLSRGIVADVESGRRPGRWMRTEIGAVLDRLASERQR
jgi:DNA-binding XRE family transcriptional regulator